MRYIGLFLLSLPLFATDSVVLFEHARYGGEALVLKESITDLRGICNDEASSIRVPAGLVVTLYEHRDFGGRQVTLTGDHPNLRHLGFNDRVSSVFIAYEEPHIEEGILLFDGVHYRGRSEQFYGDDANLRDNFIGNDQVRSLVIPRGWSVVLYEHKNFRGRSELLHASDGNLANNPIGLDQVSSIRVKPPVREYTVRRDRSRTRADVRRQVTRRNNTPPVILFEHADYRGRQEAFYGHDPNLSDNLIGNDRLTSLRIPEGYEVILYEHVAYQGRAQKVTGNIADLSWLAIGNDRVSSIRIQRIEDRYKRR